MRVTILHQNVPDDATPDERDVLVQVEAVQAALRNQGHHVSVLPCSLNLELLQEQLRDAAPNRVFNLVESLGGTDALQFVVPALLETLGLRFTGASSAAIWSAGRKVDAKIGLLRSALPTPGWVTAAPSGREGNFIAGCYIIKPQAEHASLGMVDADVVTATELGSLQQRIRDKSRALGRECFAEQFIDGREFNLSMLETADGPAVLPAAEIRFVDYPPDKPRIVGSAAKWAEDSFEYRATVRSFEFAEQDAPLLARLSRLATDCWSALQLSGYARVDFRVDNSGNPWILEGNANPCLSPDAGFAAAAAQAGLGFEDVVARILAAS